MSNLISNGGIYARQGDSMSRQEQKPAHPTDPFLKDVSSHQYVTRNYRTSAKEYLPHGFLVASTNVEMKSGKFWGGIDYVWFIRESIRILFTFYGEQRF